VVTKLAIMQPYFFPYLGYFQLVAAVDKFVFYDDVNFIKSGWINRNRINTMGQTRYFTAPLCEASSFKKINQISVKKNDIWRRKMTETIRYSYGKAPQFKIVNDLLNAVLFSGITNISDLAKYSVTSVANYLGLTTQFVFSSSIYENSELSGVRRVIDICIKEMATEYINLPGGRNLYDGRDFSGKGIDLYFVSPCQNRYASFPGEQNTGLSILDTLMFCDRNSVREMLHTEKSN